jgi:hypothetical protein
MTMIWVATGEDHAHVVLAKEDRQVPVLRRAACINRSVTAVSSGDMPAVGSSRMSNSGRLPKGNGNLKDFLIPVGQGPAGHFRFAEQADAVEDPPGLSDRHEFGPA